MAEQERIAMGEPQKAMVLDVCCSARSFWFNKNDPRAVFMDVRQGRWLSTHKDRAKKTEIIVAPDVVADFQAIPFADDSFALVVFDPPHLPPSRGRTSTLVTRYGILSDHWEVQFRHGFRECFRVLAPGGTLIFKWASVDIPLSDVLRLTPAKPLFGHRTGARTRTHWVAFVKEQRDG